MSFEKHLKKNEDLKQFNTYFFRFPTYQFQYILQHSNRCRCHFKKHLKMQSIDAAICKIFITILQPVSFDKFIIFQYYITRLPCPLSYPAPQTGFLNTLCILFMLLTSPMNSSHVLLSLHNILPVGGETRKSTQQTIGQFVSHLME